MITRQHSGTCLNIYMAVLVSVCLKGLGDGRNSGPSQPPVFVCVSRRGGSWHGDINGEIIMLVFEDRLTPKHRRKASERLRQACRRENRIMVYSAGKKAKWKPPEKTEWAERSQEDPVCSDRANHRAACPALASFMYHIPILGFQMWSLSPSLTIIGSDGC